MNILALDCSGRTVGWASIWRGVIDSGVKAFAVGRGESPGMAWLRFRRWLREIGTIALDGSAAYDLIVYEQAHLRGGAATHVAETLIGYVEEFAAEYGIEHQPVHSRTLKAYATANGNAGKPLMLSEAQRRWPEQTWVDDNEVDAWWLLQLAQEQYGEVAQAAEEGRDGA